MIYKISKYISDYLVILADYIDKLIDYTIFSMI